MRSIGSQEPFEELGRLQAEPSVDGRRKLAASMSFIGPIPLAECSAQTFSIATETQLTCRVFRRTIERDDRG